MNLSLPIKHAHARAIAAPRYNTGKACKHGHFSDRYTCTGHCIECVLIRGEKMRGSAERKQWKSSYDKTAKAVALQAARNARYLAKPEKAAAYKIAKAKWHRENLASGRMYTATRRARLDQATPPWVDMGEILKVYAEADRITRETGVPHEVDHFYPIAGRNSCGLHVHWNLRIVTMVVNRRKSNKAPEDL